MDEEFLRGVEAHVTRVLGAASARASVTFLGAERVDVLRHDAGEVVHYVTLGMSRAPLPDPASELVRTEGPRAELVLSLRALRDDVLRALAATAMSPFVENAVVAPGASLDLGEPLWPGARFTALLVGEPGAPVPTLPSPVGEVAFFPVVPMTPNEAAFKRVHGAAALEERWLSSGADPRDPERPEVSLS